VAGLWSGRLAIQLLHRHPTHLVRSFTAAFGVPPHANLTGRRIDLARQLLLAGEPPTHVATAAGFYNQAHLTRQFRKCPRRAKLTHGVRKVTAR
jgi:AraC-like DNA-binding protein